MKQLKTYLLLLAILLIPYFILCFFAQPSADDFSVSRGLPPWDVFWQLYKYWNGRYISNFWAVTDPMLFNSLAGYRIAAFCLLLLLPVSVLFMLSYAMGKAMGLLQKMSITLVLTILILAMMPSVAEGIYWYDGAITYTLGSMLAMLFAGTSIHYFLKKPGKNFLIFCILLLFFSIGFNEVQTLLLLLLNVIVWIKFKKPFLLIFCILFSLLVIFSPGNHFRENNFPGNHRFFHSFSMSILQMLRFFFIFVSYVPLILSGILFAPISLKLQKRSVFFRGVATCKPWVLFSFLWLILFISVFPCYWSTGILGQHRTLNVACFYFVPCWFLLLHSIYSRNNLSVKISAILNPSLKFGLTVFLFFCLLFSGNCGTAIMELATGKITGFNKEMNNRYNLLTEAKEKGLKDVSVPTIQNKPASLFVLDIQPGCGGWMNKMYAKFFSLNEVCADSVTLQTISRK